MRKRNSKAFLHFTLFLYWLLGAVVSNGQDPVFSALVSNQKVVQNSVFEVQFELKNAAGDKFTPPSFSDFRVVGGPSMGSSTMIVNGHVSRSQSWTYSLLANKQGKFVIPSAMIISGGKKLATKPVAIEVLAAKDIAKSNADAPGAETVLLKAEIDNREYFPGQQIIVRYILLFRENVQNVNLISEDGYADFFIQNFNAISRESASETINGVSYTSRIIKAVALFAHQSGTYTIDPLVIDVGINAPYPANQGFFTMRRLRNVQVASSPLTITVLPLPVPVPDGYSGAVGKYSLKTIPVSSQITTDDDFALRLEIIGDGDSRRWDPPVPVTDNNFELYDPRINEDIFSESGGAIQHSRMIEYLMIPQQAGEFHVYVPFTFFDPVAKRYETIYSDTTHLQVAQGNSLARRGIIDTTENQPRAIRPVNARRSDDRFWLSIPHLALFGVILCGACWGMIITMKRRREDAIPKSERIRSAAARNARQQLDSLEADAVNTPMSDKLFFEKATEVYYKFLSEKFNIPPADLDKDKLRLYLGKAGLKEEVVERAVRFFDQCLSVRYGGIPGGFTRDEMIVETKSIIDLLGS